MSSRSSHRRALGLDLGERRVGVAVSDSKGVLAVPVCTIDKREAGAHWRAEVRRLVGELGVEVVVVGLPIGLDGELGTAAHAALEDSRSLSVELATSGVEVVTQDERFTTVQAHRALSSAGERSKKRRGRVDSSAAAFLLQAWLDSVAGSERAAGA